MYKVKSRTSMITDTASFIWERIVFHLFIEISTRITVWFLLEAIDIFTPYLFTTSLTINRPWPPAFPCRAFLVEKPLLKMCSLSFSLISGPAIVILK